MHKSILVVALTAPLVCTSAFASIDSYFSVLLGSNQVPVAGDPDGFGQALVSIDNVANSVSWTILANNVLLPLSGAHIHSGAAGTNGPVIVDFSSSFSGDSLVDPDLASITPLTASNFYINIHNAVYPAGAIRGQLQYITTVSLPVPEPESYALLIAGLGVLGYVAKRRARAGS